MSRENHQKIKKQFAQLKIDLQKLNDNYLEQISNVINKAIKNYKDKDLWKESYNHIVDLFYEALTETYLQTTIALKTIYNGNISDDIPDMEDFIYKDDGKTLSERIKGYWDEAKKLLKDSSFNNKKDSNKNQTIILYLLNMYDRILSNEIQNIKTGIQEAKIIKNMGNLIPLIEIYHTDDCSCGMCDLLEGFYLEEDDPGHPPFHIGCQCEWWRDFYDPNDPQDLEILQEAGWEEDDR